MKTLFIPDVHERVEVLKKLEPLMEKADRVVFLGDFFDTFSNDKQALATAQWLKPRLYDSKFTVLWGNHDCHYAFTHPMFRCSGYLHSTQTILDKEFKEDDWRRFKPFTRVSKYLVSHAGFRPETKKLLEEARQAVENASKGMFHNFWMPGWSVGGPAKFGGPTWLRWWELKDIGDPQIVGHTPLEKPEIKEDGSINLDTHSKYVAWVDEDSGKVSIEEVS